MQMKGPRSCDPIWKLTLDCSFKQTDNLQKHKWHTVSLWSNPRFVWDAAEWPWWIDSFHHYINLPRHHLTRLSVTMCPIRRSPPSHSLHICPSSCHLHSDGLPVIRYKSQPVTARFLHTVSPNSLHFSSSSPRGVISFILLSRVSAERRQSAQLVLCGDGQQSGAFPVLPLPTQFPPSDPQGESRHEGVWQWASCVACILCTTKEKEANFFQL